MLVSLRWSFPSGSFQDPDTEASRCHMINIVTLSDGKKYMLDVGFGGNGPIQPLLLDPEHSHSQYIPPAEVRLIYDNIPDNTDPNQKLWIYQHRMNPDAPWVPMYCFTELEFLPSDYELMNMRTSQSRTSFFTYRVMVVKMILEGGEVVGTLMLVGAEVKRRVGGKVEHIMTCKTEAERVQALEKWFGIRLREDEKVGIKGMVTELHGGEPNIGD